MSTLFAPFLTACVHIHSLSAYHQHSKKGISVCCLMTACCLRLHLFCIHPDTTESILIVAPLAAKLLQPTLSQNFSQRINGNLPRECNITFDLEKKQLSVKGEWKGDTDSHRSSPWNTGRFRCQDKICMWLPYSSCSSSCSMWEKIPLLSSSV